MPGLSSILASKSHFGKKSFYKNALIFAAATLPVIASLTLCEDKNSSENISLYLKPESKESLSKFLTARGIKGKQPQFVCFSRNATADQQYVFKPLYGQRAAFRLKGLVQTDTGIVVGVGRVSTMVGEVKDDDFIASIPFFDTVEGTAVVPGEEELNRLIDIPTRVDKTRRNHTGPLWKGRLPADKVRAASHSAISGVTYISLPVEKQVVVEGYICSSKYADSEGHCMYDRDLDPDEQLVLENETPSERTAPSAEVSHQPLATADNNTVDAPAEPAECPICKYMKAGACKQEFIDWDTCVKNASEEDLAAQCFKFTSVMMKCMRNHEYYDIMTAGTDYAKLEEAEKLAKSKK